MSDAQSKLLALAQADPEAVIALLNKLQTKTIVPHEGGQREIMENDTRFQIVCCGRRFGKALPTIETVLTPRGWIQNGELKVGDEVIGVDGKPQEVEGVYPQGELDSYRVTFNDGSTVDCSEDHLWTVRTRTPEYRRPWRTLTLREIMDRGLEVRKGLKFKIPAVAPIEFEEKELPIDPYVLGVILGDGCIRANSVSFTSADEEIVSEMRRLCGAEVVHRERYDYGCVERLSSGNSLLSNLRELNLTGKRSWEKHIPDEYKYASISQREALLQGLMDTDGWAETTNQVALSSASEQLRDDVRELMRSLGGRPISWLKKTTHRDAYLVQGSLPPDIKPFRLKRKAARYTPTKLTFDRSIVSIEKTGRTEMQCIKVSKEDGLFVTKDYAVTHNTVVGAKKALRTCRQSDKMVWWVAPTYKVVKRGYKEVLRQLPDNVLTHVPPQESAFDAGRAVALKFKNGSRIEFYSAERPDGMLGEGVDFVVLDEAATMGKSVWEQIVRPTLIDREGRALMISTPRGRNWFYYLWLRGQKDSEKLYKSWRFPTSANPHLPASEIGELRTELPLLTFEQEVLAEFIASSGTVFRFGEKAIVQRVKPEGHVVVGIDLAKSNDFTVFSAARISDLKPCGFDTFTDVAWSVQRNRIKAFVKRLERAGAEHVTLVMDSTGVGDPIVEDIESEGFDVVPINFTKTKQHMVTQLSKDLEDGHVFIDQEENLSEYENYAYKITDGGRWTYSAPEGQHDDCVSAKMLQHWGLVQAGSPGLLLVTAAPDNESGAEEANPEEYRYLEEDDYAEDTGIADVKIILPDSPSAIMQRSWAWSARDY